MVVDASAMAYNETDRQHMINSLADQMAPDHPRQTSSSEESLSHHGHELPLDRHTKKRTIPKKVIIGYATHCNLPDDTYGVKTAVRNGVNIVIWAFLEIHRSNATTSKGAEYVADLSGPLDLNCIRQMIHELDNEGYNDTLHLVSVGGWNGPHLDENISGIEWYSIWRNQVGNIFHGIDFDLEGNTNLTDSNNYFTIDCLNKMGTISKLAHSDGYVVSIVPAQSYLDIGLGGTTQFSLHVNLTETRRPWHAEFNYFGRNVYAYLLAKYPQYIDLIIIQFYESYSRASMFVNCYEVSHEKYLEMYIQTLYQQQFQHFVDFEHEPLAGIKSQRITIPLSKLVLGFANVGGDVNANLEKNVYFDPTKIQSAYERLHTVSLTPRGFMFWVIDREGKHGVYYAKGLNDILHIRPHKSNNTRTVRDESSSGNINLIGLT